MVIVPEKLGIMAKLSVRMQKNGRSPVSESKRYVIRKGGRSLLTVAPVAGIDGRDVLS
jgi:hypothetical protein